jgi:anthranilate synthase/aminodeoxychorismate synthase-like glutamine amidotransferase
MIDNYDSFTYNLVQMFEILRCRLEVHRNDRVELDSIEAMAPSAIVISPGPGTPEKAGVSVEAVRTFGSSIPVLGVCLGHQAVAAAFGGEIVRAERIMHGKTSRIFHDGRTLFRETPNPFEAVRYHSLLVRGSSLPDCLEVSAWTESGEIMGLRHREYPVEGVQFHPESILTETGTRIIENFLQKETGTSSLQSSGREQCLVSSTGCVN